MAITTASRLAGSRLVVRWALWGAVIAGFVSGALLLPALMHFSRDAAVAGFMAIAGSAIVGAVAAILYQLMGRLRFWGGVLVLSMAYLIYLVKSGVVSGMSNPLVWVGVVAITALSLWVLLAYGLHRLRRR